MITLSTTSLSRSLFLPFPSCVVPVLSVMAVLFFLRDELALLFVLVCVYGRGILFIFSNFVCSSFSKDVAVSTSALSGGYFLPASGDFPVSVSCIPPADRCLSVFVYPWLLLLPRLFQISDFQPF